MNIKVQMPGMMPTDLNIPMRTTIAPVQGSVASSLSSATNIPQHSIFSYIKEYNFFQCIFPLFVLFMRSRVVNPILYSISDVFFLIKGRFQIFLKG